MGHPSRKETIPMFDRIAIQRQKPTGAIIDLGLLAECLLFYDKVRILADGDSFKYLMRCCGPDELMELISMGALEIEFFENLTAVGELQTNIGPVYEIITADSHPLHFPQVSRKLADELAGPSGKGASKMYRQFQLMVERSRYTPEMLAESHADLVDAQYLPPAVKSVLSLLAPEYQLPNPFVFQLRTVLKGGTYQVTTNVDFAAANESYNRHAPPDYRSVLNVSYLLGFVADTRRDLIVGSRHQSEFAMTPERAIVASYKFAEILTKAGQGISVADAFQEMVVDGLPSVRDAINSGGRNFRDLIKLLEQARRFKDWLRKQGATEDLREPYLRDVSHIDWAEKLPPKSLRWLLVTGAGVALGGSGIGLAAGLGLSAADTFLLDKLIKGWKPNQFIQGPLKKFLQLGH